MLEEKRSEIKNMMKKRRDGDEVEVGKTRRR
jgi:hypothetical protein